MDLKLNQAVRIIHDVYQGDYRIVALSEEEVFLAVIQSNFKGLKKRNVESVNINNQCTSLLILKKIFIHELVRDLLITQVEFVVTNSALKSIDGNQNNPKIIDRYEKSIHVMKSFLDLSSLSQKIIKDRSFSHVIGKTVQVNKCDYKYVYRRLQRLILHGFTESSLIPEFFNSGGPGKARLYKDGAKVGGAKPLTFQLDVKNNKIPTDNRSGMKEEWKTKCAIAIEKYYKPGVSVRALYYITIEKYFSPNLVIKDGQLQSVQINEAEIPTYDQFKYFFRNRYSKLDHLKRRTSRHNFQQNHRALLGTSRNGVGGPGHTYAIDSTIADVFLVRASNRATIAGRPIVYFLVDLYSGAIVGFYVCWDGPKWDTAKIALFCTAYDSEKLCKLTGVPHFEVFRHQPGLPRVLLGDRGEYIAKKAIVTCTELMIDQEFTAPYRGDGKGDVEVQFKHLKDDQLNSVPGAHDAKRPEMEKRKSHPLDATMTLHEFVIYVSSYVRRYNLTADMSSRLTDSMKAAKVKPTPAGIWDWGFDNGIGYSTHNPENDLIRTLLPKATAKSSPNGIKLDKRLYADPDEPLDVVLAAEARNFGVEDVNVWYYPGNIHNIWTDNGVKQGFRSVPRKDNDSQYVSIEEYEDDEFEFRVYQSEFRREKLEISVRENIIKSNVISESKIKSKNSKPTSSKNIKENQKHEINFYHHQSTERSTDKSPDDLTSMLDSTKSEGLKDQYQAAFDEVDNYDE